MGYYLTDLFLICFGSVLFIENTIFFIPESDASKTIFRRKTLLAVPEISTMKEKKKKMTIMCLNSSERVVAELWIDVHV